MPCAASSVVGQLSEDRAADARTDVADLTIVRYGHGALADRTWELRHDLTAYDATFVALAEALGVPLVTCDARLAERRPGTPPWSSCTREPRARPSRGRCCTGRGRRCGSRR